MTVNRPAPTDCPDVGLRSPGRTNALTVALPPLVLGVATLWVLVLAIAGRDPVWAVGEMTISEAAATRDRGGVARMIGEGVNPNAR